MTVIGITVSTEIQSNMTRLFQHKLVHLRISQSKPAYFRISKPVHNGIFKTKPVYIGISI